MTSEFNTEQFAAKDWKKNWAGGWSLLTCSFFGYQFTKQLAEVINDSLRYSLFISHNGYTSCFFERLDLQRFGQSFANELAKDPEKSLYWCTELKKKTDDFITLITRLKTENIEKVNFYAFIDALYAYGVPHRVLKIAVDFLSPELLQKYLPKFTEARLYAEPVYGEAEVFMQYFAQQYEQKINLASHLILCLTKDELLTYFSTGELPDKSGLEERYLNSALLFESGEYKLISGAAVQELEQLKEQSLLNTKELHGVSAFVGKAKGVVKVVLDPKQSIDFNEGDVLVTGMTRPEYLPLVKKSSAFITDAGGLLSHAAITARELKKPCIIAAEIATKVLKDGDQVEVDAEKGIVKILKKAKS